MLSVGPNVGLKFKTIIPQFIDRLRINHIPSNTSVQWHNFTLGHNLPMDNMAQSGSVNNALSSYVS